MSLCFLYGKISERPELKVREIGTSRKQVLCVIRLVCVCPRCGSDRESKGAELTERAVDFFFQSLSLSLSSLSSLSLSLSPSEMYDTIEIRNGQPTRDGPLSIDTCCSLIGSFDLVFFFFFFWFFCWLPLDYLFCFVLFYFILK